MALKIRAGVSKISKSSSSSSVTWPGVVVGSLRSWVPKLLPSYIWIEVFIHALRVLGKYSGVGGHSSPDKTTVDVLPIDLHSAYLRWKPDRYSAMRYAPWVSRYGGTHPAQEQTTVEVLARAPVTYVDWKPERYSLLLSVPGTSRPDGDHPSQIKLQSIPSHMRIESRKGK